MDHVNQSRRQFLKNTATGTSLLATTPLAALPIPALQHPVAPIGQTNPEKLPWYKTVTRWGQINITEKDPEQYDIGWWRQFWKTNQTQGVIINAGGIVAYYPTKIPYHHKATYLGDRDLFGELCQAAHDDGLAVFARMDSNRAHEDAYNAHPDWFALNGQGKPYRADDLYIACVNSPYYGEHIPAIMTEIVQLYKPDGFTDNSWSGLGRNSICYCDYCKKSFKDKVGQDIPLKKDWDDKVYKQWIRWNYDRRIEIWELNNRTTKAAGGPDCTWSGMNSGSMSGQSQSFRDYKEIAKRADILMLDEQSRTDAGGFQHNSELGKRVHGLLGWDKLAPESMALYQHVRPWFRLSSKPAAESRLWMVSGIAGGIQPWWHMISAYHEDRRMYHTPEPIFNWYKTNEAYLINRKPVANIGVVWSQLNIDFYGRDSVEERVELPWRGMTQALIRARITYLPVHVDHIDRDAGGLSVLVLPNLALMTTEQMAAVRRFVQKGGSVVATGETSLYDEWGDARPDYGLADLFGVHMVETGDKTIPAEKAARDAYHTYMRLTPELRATMKGPHTSGEPKVGTAKRHPILKGFEETDILPFGGLLEPKRVEAGVEVLMTYIPQFPTYPPEKAYMRTPKTDIPAIVVCTGSGGGRVVFIPADIDKQFGLLNLPDHADLLTNAVRWAAKEDFPLRVEGAGLLDCHVYEQPGRLIVHMVNLTNAATWRQPLDELISIGPFKLTVKLPAGVRGKKGQLLVLGRPVTLGVRSGSVTFDLESIQDHEVIVIS